MNDAGSSALDRLPSGIRGLDTILGGGFFKGGLYIIQGTPGTGKTTFASQICFHHLAAGGRALYTTLLAEYHVRMMQHMGGMSFFDASKIPDQLTYLNGFGTLRETGYRGLRDLVRREVAAHQATVLILDGFATVQRTAPDQQDFNEFVHELQAIAMATECTMFLLSSAERVKETPEYTIVDGIVELSDQPVGWSSESLLQVVKLRGTSYLRGRHAFRITNDGLVVYPRIEALLAWPTRADRGAVGTLSSGVDRLDVMLGGGLPKASTTMVMGPSGAGKTTLGLQFLSKCSKSEPGLLLGFYETPPRIRAKTQEVCRPLADLLDDGTVEMLWQPPTEGLLDAYADRLLQAVRRRGVRRLLIDGLSAFQTAATTSVRMSQYLTALMNELRVLEVTTLYTLELPDIIGLGIRPPIDDVSVLADNLILMRYLERTSRLHRFISILKVRNSDFDTSMREYTATAHGLKINETPDRASATLSDPSVLDDDAEPETQDMQPRRGA